jgi:hypothetical protein
MPVTNLGKKFSEETKKKMSESAKKHYDLIGRKGRKTNCSLCGSVIWRTKRSTRCFKCFIKSYSGKMHPLWKGGKPKCIDCDKGVYHYTTRCFDCYWKFNIGQNSPQWKGGITSLSEKIRKSNRYKQWRKEVFERDSFTCQFCGQIGGNLCIDHIKMFALIIKENNIKSLEESLICDELWEVKNGRVLCFHCHKLTPTYLKKLIYAN